MWKLILWSFIAGKQFTCTQILSLTSLKEHRQASGRVFYDNSVSVFHTSCWSGASSREALLKQWLGNLGYFLLSLLSLLTFCFTKKPLWSSHQRKRGWQWNKTISCLVPQLGRNVLSLCGSNSSHLSAKRLRDKDPYVIP